MFHRRQQSQESRQFTRAQFCAAYVYELSTYHPLRNSPLLASMKRTSGHHYEQTCLYTPAVWIVRTPLPADMSLHPSCVDRQDTTTSRHVATLQLCGSSGHHYEQACCYTLAVWIVRTPLRAGMLLHPSCVDRQDTTTSRHVATS